MSQNTFTSSSIAGGVRVRAGWDAPLQEFFCSVERLEGGKEVADLPDCFYGTSYPNLDAMASSLARAGINLPPGFLEVLKEDLHNQTGNVIRDFDRTPPSRTRL